MGGVTNITSQLQEEGTSDTLSLLSPQRRQYPACQDAHWRGPTLRRVFVSPRNLHLQSRARGILSLRSWCFVQASAVWPLVLVLGPRFTLQPSQPTVRFESLSAPSTGSLFRHNGVGFTLCLKDVVNSITAAWFHLNDLTDWF